MNVELRVPVMLLQSPPEQCLFTLNLVLFCSVLTALAVCSEDYFSAVAKMGEQALQTFTSHSLGKNASTFALKV